MQPMTSSTRPQPLGRAGAEGGPDASGSHVVSLADFFAEALDGAMHLIHADGGEIATLDESRSGHAMVLRARRTRPRIDPTLGPMGTRARHSQPAGGSPHAYPAPPGIGYARPSLAGPPSIPPIPAIPDETGGTDAIDEQSTQLLPAALLAGTYRRGERLIGFCWQRAEPVVMRNEDCRKLPSSSAPPEADAAWHLAVPILRPASLAVLRPGTDVVGVISVYNRDPTWSFTARDVELLTLHADRIAREMHAADLARQAQSQADLLAVLGTGLSGEGGQTIYQRLRDVVRRMIYAPYFAVVLYDPRRGEVTIEPADQQVHGEARRMPAALLPPWWQAAQVGRTVRISAPEERAQHPEYCVLGWSDDQPVQSILVAPLAARGALLGALVAASPRPDVYAPEHARLFTAIARSAATVIQNALLASETHNSIERTRQKEEQLSKLNNALLTLNASLDLESTVRQLARHAKELTDAAVCIVFLFDRDADCLVGHAANLPMEAAHTPLAEVRVPLGWRGLRAIVRNGQFQLMENLVAEWDDDTPVGRWLAEYRVRSGLIVPLTHNDEPLGALLVYTPDLNYHFMPREIGLLQGLASQGAGAIYNAQMHQTLQDAFKELQELDKKKDDFILTVSHEFRTPVTAIEGYVTLISRHGQKLDQSKLSQFADEIHQATNQLMGMINTLNEANAISGKQPEVTLAPIRVRAAVEKVVATLDPEAKTRVLLYVSDDLWVLADERGLTRVITNLLSNAVKYSPAPKPVHVTARIEPRERLAREKRKHALPASAADRWVVVGVRDWGEGISAEDKPKLFQKFVRLSRSLTTSVRGTGLGLWICRQNMDAMGGDIWVESEFGNGALFEFILPCVPPPQGPPA
jgi:signal transduction histidine kinase